MKKNSITGDKKGFTLLEILIAVALSSLALVGIIEMATSMISQHFESISQGVVSGDTLASLDQMNSDIENATDLVEPPGGSGNVVAGCSNWSQLLANGGGSGELNAYANAPNGNGVTAFYYCATKDQNYTNQNPVYDLWSYSYADTSGTKCLAVDSPPSTCGSAAPKWSAPNSVVYNSLYQDGNTPLFSKTATNDGVMIHFVVGNPNAVPSPSLPHPVSYSVNNVIMMQKNYMDAND